VSDASQRAQAQSWFAQKTGGGESAAARMAVLYAVLLERDASKQPGEKAEKKRVEKKPAKPSPPATPAPHSPALATAGHREPANLNSPQIPGININLEIHISADSTPDQIDAIFASMSKHIYQRG
jgi:hypothetical protein